MRQGITTKYLGPTNSRGSRIKATARKASSFGAEMSVTIPYDYSGNTDHVHAKAAQALAVKLGWSGLWIAGGKPDEDGNMYVNISSDDDFPDGRFGRENSDWFYVPQSDA